MPFNLKDTQEFDLKGFYEFLGCKSQESMLVLNTAYRKFKRQPIIQAYEDWDRVALGTQIFKFLCQYKNQYDAFLRDIVAIDLMTALSGQHSEPNSKKNLAIINTSIDSLNALVKKSESMRLTAEIAMVDKFLLTTMGKNIHLELNHQDMRDINHNIEKLSKLNYNIIILLLFLKQNLPLMNNIPSFRLLMFL